MSSVTAGTGMPRKWPQQRTILALLLVSAALNLFFVVGAAWTHWQPRRFRADLTQQYQAIAAKLDLNPSQQAAFNRYVAALRERSSTMHEETHAMFTQTWQEIGKPSPDRQHMLQLVDQSFERRRQLVHDAIAQTLDFMSVLSPAQRSKFVALEEERHRRWWQRHGKRR